MREIEVAVGFALRSSSCLVLSPPCLAPWPAPNFVGVLRMVRLASWVHLPRPALLRGGPLVLGFKCCCYPPASSGCCGRHVCARCFWFTRCGSRSVLRVAPALLPFQLRCLGLARAFVPVKYCRIYDCGLHLHACVTGAVMASTRSALGCASSTSASPSWFFQ